MTARPMTIRRYGPAFDGPINADRRAMERFRRRGPVIEMMAHPDDGGHFCGWYPATPDGLILAGAEFARLKSYGFRQPPVCSIDGRVIARSELETAVVAPLCRREALRRAAALLRDADVAL